MKRFSEAVPESRRRVLLARMAATRAELCAANRVVETTRRAWGSGSGGQPVSVRAALRTLTAFRTLAAPGGAALAVALVGIVAMGPRRLVVTAVRAGLAALVTRMVRDAVHR